MGLYVYFGVPGSGKTTLAAKIVLDNLRHGVLTYSNVDIKGSLPVSADDLGKYQIENGDLILDEAGIEFNSRAYKSLPQSTIKWLKLYRHYGIRNIYVFSQSYEDMDITLRRLADGLFIVRRSMIPFFHFYKRIAIRIGIDKDTHQIVSQYFFPIFGKRYFFAPAYWHMFDSWEAPALPDKQWGIFTQKDFKPSDLKSLYKIFRWQPFSHARRHISTRILRPAQYSIVRTYITLRRFVSRFLSSRGISLHH